MLCFSFICCGWNIQARDVTKLCFPFFLTDHFALFVLSANSAFLIKSSFNDVYCDDFNLVKYVP